MTASDEVIINKFVKFRGGGGGVTINEALLGVIGTHYTGYSREKYGALKKTL